MPRHDKGLTPPEKRRAARGSVVGSRTDVKHTAQSRADLETLQARWERGQVETIREALRRCAARED